MPQLQAAPVDVELYLHVRVLISIILGLSVARLISGVAGFIHRPTSVSSIHFGWVAWSLLNVLTFWWWEFRLSQVHWSFGLYLFIVLYASMYFFLSALLFPDDIEGYERYQDYFLARRGWFFGLFALTEALDVVDTWIKGDAHLHSLGPEYFLRLSAFLVLCGIASATRNLAFHRMFVVVGFIYEVSFFTRYLSSVATP